MISYPFCLILHAKSGYIIRTRNAPRGRLLGKQGLRLELVEEKIERQIVACMPRILAQEPLGRDAADEGRNYFIPSGYLT